MILRLQALLASLALAAVLAPTAVAASVANDRMSAPIAIRSIPGSVRVDTTRATSSTNDPAYCAAPEFGPDLATVWFSYAATTSGPLGATTFGSDYDTTLYVGTSDHGKFQQLACGDDSRTPLSAVRFDATAGVTYLFAVGASVFAGVNGGNLVFNLDVGPPSQVVDVALEPAGTLANGKVIFQGTVSCTAPTTFQSVVIVELDQGTGPRAPDYIGFADITSCPGTDIPFEIVVEQQIGTVRPGPVTLQVIFAACNDFECGSKTIDSMPGVVTK